jgi:hypothetical protein
LATILVEASRPLLTIEVAELQTNEELRGWLKKAVLAFLRQRR